MRCGVRLQTKDGVDEGTIKGLIAAAEHSCVVMQTLRNGVTVQTQVGTNHSTAAMG